MLRGDRLGDRGRAVYSEYHAHGTSRGVFVIRQDRCKYVYYPNNPDQLFDLDAYPDEMENMASDPAYTAVRERFEDMLRAQVDPDKIDRQAHADQRRRKEQSVEEWWGVSGHG